ncbi:hypothetical protein [Nodularia spumigena]|uniref:hypothetical protein n=1 Tax=Nodularia spumigena TaxID=70799 RepID=UPI00232E50F9|nr:hypothetical protein [Nodularia spumigena]
MNKFEKMLIGIIICLIALVLFSISGCAKNDLPGIDKTKITLKVFYEHPISVKHTTSYQGAFLEKMLPDSADTYEFNYLASPGDSIIIEANGKPQKWYRLNVYADGRFWFGVGSGCGGFQRLAWKLQ